MRQQSSVVYTHAVTCTECSFCHAKCFLAVLVFQGRSMANPQITSSCSSSTGSALLYPFDRHHKNAKPLQTFYLNWVHDKVLSLLPSLPLLNFSFICLFCTPLSRSAAACHVRVALCQWPSVGLPLQSRET